MNLDNKQLNTIKEQLIELSRDSRVELEEENAIIAILKFININTGEYEKIEKTIRDAVANQELEGLKVTEEEKIAGLKCLFGMNTHDEVAKSIIERYTNTES